MKNKYSIGVVSKRNTNTKILQENGSNYASPSVYAILKTAEVEANNNKFSIISLPFIESFINKCNDTTIANDYIKECIDLLGDIQSNNKFHEANKSKFTNIYIENVLPKIKNLEKVKILVESKEIFNKDKILDSIKEFKISDRVLNNHEKLCKRFNLNKFINENNYLDVDDLIIETCKLIDTYNMPTKAKLNIALENIKYLFYNNAIKCEDSDLVKYTTEYFLHRKEINVEDLNGIKKVLIENSFINELDLKEVLYIFKEDDIDDMIEDGRTVTDNTFNDYFDLDNVNFGYEDPNFYKESIREAEDGFFTDNEVKKLMDKYKKESKKTPEGLKGVIKKIYTKSPKNILQEMPNVLSWIRTFFVCGTFAINPIVGLLAIMADQFIALKLKRDDAERMVKIFKKEKTKTESKIGKCKNEETKERYNKYLKSLDDSINKLETYRDSLYTEKELDKRNEIEEAANMSDVDKLSVGEYMNKYHGLVSKQLKLVFDAIGRFESPDKKSGLNFNLDYDTFKYFINADSGEISEFLDQGSMINIPFCTISIDGTDDNTVEDYCNDIEYKVEILQNMTDENIMIICEGLQLSMIFTIPLIDEVSENTMYYNVKNLCSKILFISENVEELDTMKPTYLLKDIDKNMDKLLVPNTLQLYTELATNYPSIIDPNQFSNILNEYKQSLNDYQKSTIISNAISKLNNIQENNLDEYENLLLEVETVNKIKNAFNDSKDKIKFTAGNTSSTIKNKVNTAGKTISNKADRVVDTVVKGVDPTTLKLASANLKKKARNLTDKERQASENVDISMSQFRKGIEKSLTTNKREAIIKGSIVPSFSKIIKAGLIAGGAYLVAPTLAVIGIIGALGVSKALTEKERQILLDEIDIELRVVEKQIAVAEEEKKMNEYGHLLSYQSKLEREQQRIKYNLKLHNKDIPKTSMSKSGKGDD